MEGHAETPGGIDPLPDVAALEVFLAACHRASMLREKLSDRTIIVSALHYLHVRASPPTHSRWERLFIPRSHINLLA